MPRSSLSLSLPLPLLLPAHRSPELLCRRSFNRRRQIVAIIRPFLTARREQTPSDVRLTEVTYVGEKSERSKFTCQSQSVSFNCIVSPPPSSSLSLSAGSCRRSIVNVGKRDLGAGGRTDEASGGGKSFSGRAARAKLAASQPVPLEGSLPPECSSSLG